MTTQRKPRKSRTQLQTRPHRGGPRVLAGDDLLSELGWVSPTPPDGEPFRRAEEAKREIAQVLFGAIPSFEEASALTQRIPAGSNVVGIGFGLREFSTGGFDGTDTVRVYVSKKQPRSFLRASEIIPSYVNGVATDVLEVGQAKPHQAGPFQACGGSIGSRRRNDGTLGCLVQRPGFPALYILSCNHVLADLNAGAAGDPIFAPGLREGGNPASPIAVLTAYPKLVFGGTPNYMDVAIAELISGGMAPEVLGIGRIQQPPLVASKFQSVKKHGFVTETTLGVVAGISEDLTVNFDADHSVHFSRQMAIHGVGSNLFSQAGDSGALVLDAASSQPVGMIIAGIGPYSVASHIGAILGTALRIV